MAKKKPDLAITVLESRKSATQEHLMVYGKAHAEELFRKAWDELYEELVRTEQYARVVEFQFAAMAFVRKP